MTNYLGEDGAWHQANNLGLPSPSAPMAGPPPPPETSRFSFGSLMGQTLESAWSGAAAMGQSFVQSVGQTGFANALDTLKEYAGWDSAPPQQAEIQPEQGSKSETAPARSFANPALGQATQLQGGQQLAPTESLSPSADIMRAGNTFLAPSASPAGETPNWQDRISQFFSEVDRFFTDRNYRCRNYSFHPQNC